MRLRLRSILVTTVLLISCALLLITSLVTQPLVAATVSTPPSVDPARLEAHVKHLSVDLYPRSFDQARHTAMTVQYITEQLRQSGAKVSLQTVSVEDSHYQNIIARFGPESGPVLVVGAHYDSFADTSHDPHDARGYSPETHTPGADDNASGVAGLLELAQLLGKAPPTRPVELVAYALEEPPFFRSDNMGSAWHANSLKASGREVSLMLSLEMIGYFSDAPGSQNYPIESMSKIYPDRGNFIALVGNMSHFGAMRHAKALMAGASPLPVLSINAPPQIPGIDFSDHQNYWKQDYPALMVTDTAFLRNPNYHQAQDSYEKLDYPRMAQVVQGVYALVKAF